MFYATTNAPLPKTADDVPMRIAIPAFIVSELTTAFQMGVVVLLPFLVVDLAVASLLMSMGMMMVPPTMVSLPLKMLLFVLADGWRSPRWLVTTEFPMTNDAALDLIRRTFIVAAQVASPALLAALAMGVFVGILQASTQVNEPSVTFLMKLLAVGVCDLGRRSLHRVDAHRIRPDIDRIDRVRGQVGGDGPVGRRAGWIGAGDGPDGGDDDRISAAVASGTDESQSGLGVGTGRGSAWGRSAIQRPRFMGLHWHGGALRVVGRRGHRVRRSIGLCRGGGGG